MRALIRFVSRGPGGASLQRDRIFDGEVITLGRATDQVINLKDRRVELEHARIVRAGGRILVSSRALAGVLVNGTVCRDASLAVGDALQIGANVLKLIAPPAGFDLAFTFELDDSVDTRAVEAPALLLTLPEVGARMQPWAWALSIVVLLGALLVPWLSSPQSGALLPTRQTLLPSDHAWQAGPLHAAHGNLSAKCESCHERPFARVADQACLACHAASLHRHVAPGSRQLPVLATARCASCHREHDEPSTLARNDEQLCINCHANPKLTEKPAPATDFMRQHPAFKTARSRDESHVKFPHDVPLSPKGIKTTSGSEVMTCAGCHEPQAGGARFQPIAMQRHCQRCHSLSFDPRAPERDVPHARPEIVLESLLEYYSAEYLQDYPDALNTARPVRRVARPGVDLSAAQRTRVLARARAQAEITARDLLERRACVVCHDVQRGKTASRWTVTPVSLRAVWMPNARFSHAAHATSLTPCKTCHAAEQSKLATDMLMPAIESCRACHAGSHSATATQIASSCTSCHDFHSARYPLWQGAPLRAAPTAAARRQ
jgi:predicted CXXCH cytochrome family protein